MQKPLGQYNGSKPGQLRYGLRPSLHYPGYHNQEKETTKPVNGYTYPQLPNAKATIRPGSILNRQGGSVFDRPEHMIPKGWRRSIIWSKRLRKKSSVLVAMTSLQKIAEIVSRKVSEGLDNQRCADLGRYR